MTDEHLQRSKPTPTPKTGSPSNPNRSAESERKSGVRPTDAEVICSWMEPRPELPPYYSHLALSPKHWWMLGPVEHGGMRWYPGRMAYPLGLDALHEVEARLTHAQVGRYIQEMYRVTLSPDGVGRQDWRLLHATAEQKIEALAATLQSRENPGDDAPATQAHQEGGS